MKHFVFAIVMTALAGCASTPDVTTDHDPAAQFSSYRTYSWGLKPQTASPLMQQRIVDGIDARLRAKGWTPAENGDVSLAAHVATSQKQTVDTFYSGTGMGGWGYSPRWGGGMGMGSATTTVRTYDVGTLVVDMFDTRSKQAIWQGTVSGTLPSSPDQLSAGLNAGLDEMFANFPPGSATTP